MNFLQKLYNSYISFFRVLLIGRKDDNNEKLTSKRAFAFLIDNMILMFVRVILISIVIYFEKQKFGVQNFQSGNVPNEVMYQIFVRIIIYFIIISVASGLFYFAYLHSSKHKATIGKIIMKIQLVTDEDKRLTINQAIYRYFVSLIPWLSHIVIIIALINKNLAVLLLAVLFFGAWYEITMFFNKKGKTMHDIICGTKIVKRS